MTDYQNIFKQINILILFILMPILYYGQTVTHPSSGTTSQTINCGATYNYYDPGGSGGNYSNNQTGTVTFNPSAGAQYIEIDFTTGAFDVERNGNGCYDYIRVYDGVNTAAPLIGTYCNSNSPGVITSSTGSLTVYFDSDGGTTGSGWAAKVTCVSAPAPTTIVHPSSGSTSQTVNCGSTYTYYDPGQTGPYSNNQTATLTLNPSSAGQYVRLNFIAMDIEPNGGGCYDYIRIYDGPSTASTLLGTYCSSNIPGTITSSTGSLTIYFDSDGGVIRSGWQAIVSCYSPCATVAGSSSSSVTSSCPNSRNTSLSLAGEGAGTIQWQRSTNGGATWTNIAGATTDPYVYSATANTMFRAAVTNGCTAYSTTSSISFACPDIIQPTSGFSTTTIQCGGSYTYKDPGNNSNYGNNQNGLITICPDVPGQFITVNFSAFDLENNFDYLYIFNGDNASAPMIGAYDASSPGTITASTDNTSGCLSFRFMSDAGTVDPGWTAAISCTSTGAAPYPTSGIEDCNGAAVICSNSSLNGGTTGIGDVQDLPSAWNDCLNFGDEGEIQSNWYAFSSTTNGTIAFLLSPNPSADYDWTIWGPYASLDCPAYTNDSPIRCSAASEANSGPNGETGLKAPATDVLETSTGDGYLKPLNVLAGEVYVMMLDNWDGNSNPFTLSWQLSNGASLDCSPPLPITLSSMEVKCDDNKTLLTWVTESEINNNFFIVEKSDDDFNFHEIGKVFGAGNSNTPKYYDFIDKEVNNKTAYYRLTQVDYDGTAKTHRVVASNCQNRDFEVITSNLNINKLNLLVSTSSNEKLTIRLYSSTGQLITQEIKIINAGSNNIELSGFNINSGIYLLSIYGEINSYSTKLIRK